ncbi:MAG: chemotaxis protein CheA, partial [Deltaproteobacteria bacterium]|nr:chemotaxis protein CheA [Deltaproteobacteria bacterium]
TLTHEVENLLDEIRHERLQISPTFIDVILDAVDILKKMIAELKYRAETGESETVEYDLPAFLERIKAIQQGDFSEDSEPERSPFGGMKIGEILVAQGLLTEADLEQIISRQQQTRLKQLGEMLLASGRISQEDLDEALRFQMESDGKKLGQLLIETGKADPNLISTMVGEQKKLREQRLGELLIIEKQADARDVAVALREQKKATEGSSVAGSTVKVDTIKLDGLVDLVGELVIAQSLVSSNDRISSLKDQKLLRDLNHMSRITSELQRTAMSMRMVPIRQTFQKMIRLVRDLSRKSGKLVDLEMKGEDTEIDRNMVDTIYDPLVHMVRNSMDHGIELPPLREKRSKPPTGHILLSAFHQGGNIVIQIEDDGQGLDQTKILAKAVERGLIGPEDHLSQTAIFNLIFQPGFSTAEKVTDVSGRGVGMDVVKKTIEKLRGKVEIQSQLDLGSTITLRLPLTLAIIDGMIVRVGENRYILPTVAIRESFRPGPQDYFTIKGQGELIKVRENLLPLVRLGEVLQSGNTFDDPTQALVVVVENEGERRCLMVDEVLGKQEIVIKSLGERMKHIKALAGGSIMGDGRVGLILDVSGLFSISDGVMGGHSRSGMSPAPAADSDWEMNQDWDMGPA